MPHSPLTKLRFELNSLTTTAMLADETRLATALSALDDRLTEWGSRDNLSSAMTEEIETRLDAIGSHMESAGIAAGDRKILDNGLASFRERLQGIAIG